MADRPRNEEWWLASDGKWYPPNLDSGVEAPEPVRRQREPSVISGPFTRVLSVTLSVASVVLMVASFFGLRYASALQKYSGQLSEAEAGSLEDVELAWASWTGLALLLLIVSGILVIGWTHSASKALDSRGPIGRRWRGGWTIGAWLIPFANLVLPKLVFNEIDRIARVPYAGVPVGEDWRALERSQLGDLWWLLWIAGVVPSQLTQILLGDPSNDSGRLAVLVNINSLTYALFCAAGIALVILVRRIERSSRT